MSLTAGAIAGLIGLSAGTSAVGGIIDSVGNYHTNKALMEQEMTFNANEAKKQRQFADQQRQMQYFDNLGLMTHQFENQQILDSQAREWQSNANQLAMDWSSNEARAQREWETEMSNTAHQREMADLKAAVSHNGAAVPNGASGSAFANSPSGSSASGGSVGLSSGSSASHNGAHAQTRIRPFDSVTEFVGNYMSNAYKMAQMADKFDKDLELLSRSQKYDYQKQMREHGMRKEERELDRDHDFEFWDYRFN